MIQPDATQSPQAETYDDRVGFKKRLAAGLIDIFILAFFEAGICLAAFLMAIYALANTKSQFVVALIYGAGVFSAFLLPFLYFAFFEGSEQQATPGKACLNLKVVTEDGTKLTKSNSLFKYFMQGLFVVLAIIISLLTGRAAALTLALLFPDDIMVQPTTAAMAILILLGGSWLYLFFPVGSDKRQSQFDKLARCRVVQIRK
jgi:uncharacterized RDD family membrane protein YckC